MSNQLIEYHIGNHVFFTSPAPCAGFFQQANPSVLKECLRKFAFELRKNEITHVVVLLTTQDIESHYQGTLLSLYNTLGFETIHYPIRDHDIPSTMESFIKLQRNLVDLTKTNHILIHCWGGIGRTGLVAAGLIVEVGSSATKALEIVREKTPGSVETEEQENFLFKYAESRTF